MIVPTHMRAGRFLILIATAAAHAMPAEPVNLLQQANAEYQAHRPAEAILLYELYLTNTKTGPTSGCSSAAPCST